MLASSSTAPMISGSDTTIVNPQSTTFQGPPQVDVSQIVCKFFLENKCVKGNQCPYFHAKGATKPRKPRAKKKLSDDDEEEQTGNISMKKTKKPKPEKTTTTNTVSSSSSSSSVTAGAIPSVLLNVSANAMESTDDYKQLSLTNNGAVALDDILGESSDVPKTTRKAAPPWRDRCTVLDKLLSQEKSTLTLREQEIKFLKDVIAKLEATVSKLELSEASLKKELAFERSDSREFQRIQFQRLFNKLDKTEVAVDEARKGQIDATVAAAAIMQRVSFRDHIKKKNLMSENLLLLPPEKLEEGMDHKKAELDNELNKFLGTQFKNQTDLPKARQQYIDTAVLVRKTKQELPRIKAQVDTKKTLALSDPSQDVEAKKMEAEYKQQKAANRVLERQNELLANALKSNLKWDEVEREINTLAPLVPFIDAAPIPTIVATSSSSSM